jgi:hypothetical protein
MMSSIGLEEKAFKAYQHLHLFLNLMLREVSSQGRPNPMKETGWEAVIHDLLVEYDRNGGTLLQWQLDYLRSKLGKIFTSLDSFNFQCSVLLSAPYTY